MARGRKTGGRQKGARNRATAEARAAAEATGILPLDYMLSVMRDASADPKRRDAMAMAAAPYLHPKVSPVEAAKTEQQSPAEKYGIRVTFVRPGPRHEDDEDVAIENSPTLQSRIGSGGHPRSDDTLAYPI
jgi:hypothetical protein